jgi:hypothetical protein
MFWSKHNVLRWPGVLALTVAVLFFASCNKGEKPAETQTQAAQKTFASPDDAAKALVEAAKTDNRDAMLSIFGPSSKDYIYSTDAVEDKASFAGFVSDYDTMHRWRKMDNGSEMLITGADNKVFPIPVKKNDAGQWYFDTQAGKEEILARRIGKNEMAAIDICAAIADAQRQYFSQVHGGVKQYAQLFISDEGKQNGLYWPQVEGQPNSPLGPVVAYATGEGYRVKPNDHRPYWGYYFVLLFRQGPDAKGGSRNYIVAGQAVGGFAVLAYPAQYGDSGIMTFIINQNGIVFEKDLGKATDATATAMTEFNPDRTWKPIGG